MKTYTYQVFLRCPNTGEVQYGKVQFDSDGFMSFKDLLKRLSSEQNIKAFKDGYTLIGMDVVDCVEGE